MSGITSTEIPKMKTTQTSGWEVAAGISASVEEIEIDELNIDENINSIDIDALQDLINYVLQKCVNQRDAVSFDKLKETDEFKQLLAECGLVGIEFDNYSDFLSKTQEIKIDTINASTGINKDDYTPSGNTEQYLSDVESFIDDLNKQTDYYNNVNNGLEQDMDLSIDEVDPTDEINRVLKWLVTVENNGAMEEDSKEFNISQINSAISTNDDLSSDLSSIISGLYPDPEINQDYTLGEGLTFHFDESGNIVVTDYDYDNLSAYLESIQNEFKDENKYTSEIVAKYVNDTNFDNIQDVYEYNLQVKNMLEEQKIETITNLYMYDIDPETGEWIFNQDYEDYFNQDRFKKNDQDSYNVYEIYQAMLAQGATLPGFDEEFYELANYMDQQQISVFIYLYETQGSAAALDYVNLFKDKKTEYEAMRELSNELETLIDWPDEINEYSDMIYEVSNYISEHYDNVTMDWDEFKNSEEFQQYIKQLAYYKYTYENPNNELDFDEWQESNKEYVDDYVNGVTAFGNSDELISSLLTAETKMTYSYIKKLMDDPSQAKLKVNIETLVLARLGGFGEGLMSGLSLTSSEREQLNSQYTASILSQSMMLNIAYQVGNQEGSMLPSMYLGMIGGYYGAELAGQTLGIFGSTDSKAVDFINSILNKDMSSGSLGAFLASNTGRAIYFADTFTNSFSSSKMNGSTTGAAIGRAFLDSLIQVGTQTFLGTIPGLSRSGEYMAKDRADAIRAWLCKALQEGTINALTVDITKVINSVLYGDEYDMDSISEEAYTQFIVGAIVGAETNVGQLANYKEKTIKITLNGLSYEVPIEDLYSLIEKNGKVSKEDMVKLVQGLSTSTISISAQAQELKEKYKLTDAEAAEIVDIMTKENVTEEIAEIMYKYGMTEEEAIQYIQGLADANTTGSVVTEEQNIDMQASVLAEQLEIPDEVAKTMIKENTSKEIAEVMYKYDMTKEEAIQRIQIQGLAEQLNISEELSSAMIIGGAESISQFILDLQSTSSQSISTRYNLDGDRAQKFKQILGYITSNEELMSIFVQSVNNSINPNKYNDFFKNYRDHTIFHTTLVTEYALALTEKMPSNLSINANEVFYGALFHDLGMQGGYYFNSEAGKYELIESIKSNPANWTRDNSYKSEMARKNHPLNSAITILTSDIVPEGVDSDVVALLAMSHSKSTSGIKDFSDSEQWKSCVDKLNTALKQYNADNGTNYSLDKQKLYSLIDSKNEFNRLINEALAIRDADAMSAIAIDKNGNTILQTGTTSTITNSKERGNDYDKNVITKAEEIEGITDIITNSDGTTEEITNTYSKMLHAGELNTQYTSQYDGTNYKVDVVLSNPNEYPNSSWKSIDERLGEVETYENCDAREFVIHLPVEAKGTKLEEFYQNQISFYIGESKSAYKARNFKIEVKCDR